MNQRFVPKHLVSMADSDAVMEGNNTQQEVKMIVFFTALFAMIGLAVTIFGTIMGILKLLEILDKFKSYEKRLTELEKKVR